MSPEALLELQAEFGEDRVRRQQVYYPSLTQSLPLIGNSSFFTDNDASVFSGKDSIVAILDTPLGNIDSGRWGNCLGGPGTGTCRISAMSFVCGDETASNDVVDGHGINVTGIVTSVATGVRVIFYDIFVPGDITGSNTTNDGIIACALNDIAARRTAGEPISAVNMSLGGASGSILGSCSTSPTSAAIRTLADTHRVMAVIAAGNGANYNGVSSPGCVPWATTVGAVYDSDYDVSFSYANCDDELPSVDQVACFSNVHGEVDLFAPGMQITAAGLSMGGTSQATPHVTGAAARLYELMGEGYTPRRATSYLRQYGVEITPTGLGTVWDTTPFPRLELMLDSENNPLAYSRSVSLLDDDSGLPGLDIPDLPASPAPPPGPVTSTIAVPAGACAGTVSSVAVDVDILHPRRGELVVELTHASTTEELTAGIADSDTRFGIRSIFTSSAFNGQSCSGDWTLSVEDTVNQNEGSLTEWTLTVQGSDTAGNVHGSITSSTATIAAGGDVTANYTKDVDATTLPSVAALYLRKYGDSSGPRIYAAQQSDSLTTAGPHTTSLTGSTAAFAGSSASAPNLPARNARPEIPAGVYDIVVRLDDQQDIPEAQGGEDAGEEDNELVSSTPLVITKASGGPDALPAAVSGFPTTLTPSMTFSGNWRAANIGSSSGNLVAEFCFIGIGRNSGTTICSPTTANVASLASGSLTSSTAFSFALPPTISSGAWLLELRASISGESDTSNNNYRPAEVLSYAMPDLVSEVVDIEQQFDDLTLEMSYQYRNAGTATAGAHSISIVTSLDEIIGNGDDQVLGRMTTEPLPAATARNGHITVDPPTLPAGADDTTRLYFALVVDSGGAILELSETNNSIRNGTAFSREAGNIDLGGGGGCSASAAGGLPLPALLLLAAALIRLRRRRAETA